MLFQSTLNIHHLYIEQTKYLIINSHTKFNFSSMDCPASLSKLSDIKDGGWLFHAADGNNDGDFELPCNGCWKWWMVSTTEVGSNDCAISYGHYDSNNQEKAIQKLP